MTQGKSIQRAMPKNENTKCIPYEVTPDN